MTAKMKMRQRVKATTKTSLERSNTLLDLYYYYKLARVVGPWVSSDKSLKVPTISFQTFMKGK